MPNFVKTSVLLKEEQVKWLKKHHITISSLVRELLDEWIEENQGKKEEK